MAVSELYRYRPNRVPVSAESSQAEAEGCFHVSEANSKWVVPALRSKPTRPRHGGAGTYGVRYLRCATARSALSWAIIVHSRTPRPRASTREDTRLRKLSYCAVRLLLCSGVPLLAHWPCKDSSLSSLYLIARSHHTRVPVHVLVWSIVPSSELDSTRDPSQTFLFGS